MNKTMRTALLYTLLGLFFVLGAGTVLYAQGYRFDIGSFAVKKVGAIYVATSPKNARIFLDGKKKESSAGLLSSGTVIQNLFPKTYLLSMSLDGYKTWERKVSVQPSIVSKIEAVLLPKESVKIGSVEPKSFFVLHGGALITKNNARYYSDGKILPNAEISDVSPGGSELIMKDGNGNYYAVQTNTSPNGIQAQKISPTFRGKLIFDTEPNQFVAYSASSIGLLALENKISYVFATEKGQSIQTADASKSLIAWTTFNPKTNLSKLWIYEKFSGNVKGFDAELRGETTELKFSPGGKLAIFQKNGDLYAYESDKDNPALLSQEVKYFQFSPLGNGLAMLKEKTLEIYFENSDFLRLNLATFEPISKILWYTDEKHIFLEFTGKIGLLDLWALNPEDVQFVASSSKNSYDPISNTLYFAESGKLSKMELPK